jgi:tetratricopeptide (TPR) repeat protein
MRAEAAALVRAAADLLDKGLAVPRHAPLPFALMNRGLAAAELGDDSGAVRAFEACLRANDALVARGGGGGGGGGGDGSDALDGVGVGSVLNNLGVSLRRLGRDADALDAWRRGLALGDPPALATAETGPALGAAAASAASSSGSSSAGKSSPPSLSYEILANAAGLLADTGDFEGALAYYGRARSLAPASAEVVNNLGFLHDRRGDWALAAAHYRDALRLLGFPAMRHAQIEANLRNAEARLAGQPA